MRVIINDRRYGALRTLGERKQAFNEVNLYVNIPFTWFSFKYWKFWSASNVCSSTHVLDTFLNWCWNLNFMLQFSVQRKKQEAEERRSKLKKAREEFKKMLEVSCLFVLKFSSYFIYTQFSLSLVIGHNCRILQSWHQQQDGGLYFLI